MGLNAKVKIAGSVWVNYKVASDAGGVTIYRRGQCMKSVWI